MSIKFFKIRFNTDNPKDRTVMNILKKADKQNAFIKNAIIVYEEKQQNEQLIDNILTAVRSELSNIQLMQTSVPVLNDEITDENTAATSADIADAFLDSL
ncbi:MAG: hypothetical protein K6F76_07505 [Clostridiales bacterium]|nr:hypothetical protein [Clostridiales bacterium]